MEFDYKQIKCPDFVKDEFPWAKSVYVFIMKPDFHPYPQDYFVCQTGLGNDYHYLLNVYLKEFAEKNIKGRYEILCDKFIDEKHLACCAGLGRMCRNNLLYSDKLKAFVNIAEIFSDEESLAEPQEKLNHPACEKCKICENVCPAKCIDNWHYDRSKCVSFLTQKKEDLTEEEKALVKNHIYGCDMCINLCPLSGVRFVRGENSLSLEFLANMSGREFKEIRNRYPFMWMGHKRVTRNAKIALEYKKRKENVRDQ